MKHVPSRDNILCKFKDLNMDKVFILISYLTVIVCALETEINFCDSRNEKVVSIPGILMKHNISQKFRVATQDLKCPTNSSLQYMTSSADLTTFHLYSSGEIVVHEIEYLLRKEFCIQRLTEQSIEIKRCEVKCGVTHTCITKCCPPNQIYDVSQPTCVSAENKIWEPVFYSAHEGCGIKVDKEVVSYHLLPSLANSSYLDHQPYKHIRVDSSEDGIKRLQGLRFRLMHDGHLESQSVNGKWAKIHSRHFCIDGMTGYINSENKPYKPLEDQVFLYADVDEEVAFDDAYSETREYLYITLMSISAVFLLATIALYLLIWEKHNIHGWTIFAFVSTMFFMFKFLAVSHIFSLLLDSDFGSTLGCKLVGILAHFFYLSTICWLSVINLDLWLTFRNVKPGGSKSQSIQRFLLYSLFAFGVPLFIVGFAVTVDLKYQGSSSFGDGTECEPQFTLPLYGEQQCYMQNGSVWFYLYIPMAILLSYNIVTFSSTVFSLFMYRNQTRNAVGSNTHQKESLILFGKLFIVTGISWVFELISNIDGEWWYWIVFDVYNLLQAVLIFMIFAMKRENLIFLYQKYPGSRFLLIPILRTSCFYAQNFDPENTEMTGVGLPSDFRNSRVHFRRGSNTSASSNSVTYKHKS